MSSPQFTFIDFKDFQLLDTGNGYRLEQWAQYRLERPDPSIHGLRSLSDAEWSKADAVFENGKWNSRSTVPDWWPVRYQLPESDLTFTFTARLTPYKHTGIFPEQAANWEWMAKVLQGEKERKILNLFGYTGAATILLTALGHKVTHVDASKPAIAAAKENQALNNLPPDSIRWILDDAAKFVEKEVKRGKRYDGILLDPPAFGHSPDGKAWKFSKDVPRLLKNCAMLLSEDADFLLMNSYATNTSSITLKNMLQVVLAKRRGNVEHGELCLKQQDGKLISTGIIARWTSVQYIAQEI